MKKRRQLDKLRSIRAMQCQQVKQEMSEQQGRLNQEEIRLQQLENYQKQYALTENSQVNGLLLGSSHRMAQSVDKAIQHQRQQVGVQQAQCRAVQGRYVSERMKLRTAESLYDSHQKVLDKKAARQEQKTLDDQVQVMLREQ